MIKIIDRTRPLEGAFKGLRIRVNQQLGRVETQTAFRCPGTVGTVTITLAGLATGQIAGPDTVLVSG